MANQIQMPPQVRHLVFLREKTAEKRRAKVEEYRARCRGVLECTQLESLAPDETLWLDSLGMAVFDQPRDQLAQHFGAENIVADFKLHAPKFDSRQLLCVTEGATAKSAWGRSAVRAPEDKPTGKGVKVCLVDTGFKKDHPDFVSRPPPVERGFPIEKVVKDFNGHGTRCAGVICGPATPTLGVPRYGVAPDVELFVANVFGPSGDTSASLVWSAVDWAIKQQCDIVSMSLQADPLANEPGAFADHIEKFEELADRALEAGTLLVACVGNTSNRDGNQIAEASFPARCRNVLAVGGIKEDGLSVMNMSNRDARVFAPGDAILSASPDDCHDFSSGTSFAAAFVAGVAALHAQDLPRPRAQALLKILTNGSGQPVKVAPGERAANLVQAP